MKLSGRALGAGIALAVVTAAGSVQGQSPATAAFEVASVKRNVSGETRVRFDTPPGRLTAINTPVRFLIRQAYRMPESRIIGGPAWLDADRFDILANAPEGVTADRDRIRQMLQLLLRDRFGLVLHQESREMPIYVLRLARPEGSLGPGLRRSTAECTGRPSSIVAGRVQCGILVSQNAASGSLRGGGATIENFARLLADFLDRPLIDQTGLTGTFDLELQFAAERSASPGAAVPGGLPAIANIDDAPLVFTALEEQLGLTLEAQRGRADVLVIDQVSPPTVE
jgi:uncharacterized protein (TIGR03435 family)